MSLKQESEGASTLWEKVKNFLKWFTQKENILMLLGATIALTAVAVPFAIIHLTKTSYTMKSFEDLGVIGDFFGGTTVGLLSLASIIFVTAAVMMQKEELKLQRKEVEKTRDEYKITNATMRKQQFDSTFFNMINLHHNILKEISYETYTGRDAIALLFDRIKTEYEVDVINNYTINLKDRILSYDDIFTRNEFLVKSFVFNKRKEYIGEFQDNAQEYFDYDPDLGGFNTDRYESKLFAIYNDTDKEWIQKKDQAIKAFNENILNYDYITELIRDIDFEGLLEAEVSHLFLTIYRDDIRMKPSKDLKIQAYENVYNKNESSIGHYYRNLYRIIRLIQDEEFDVSKEKNEKERKKYRGILRAQLSSYELMMIFYNVTYSRKGEKFRTYLKNTNFFDDHLIQDEFIWPNDKEELIIIN